MLAFIFAVSFQKKRSSKPVQMTFDNEIQSPYSGSISSVYQKTKIIMKKTSIALAAMLLLSFGTVQATEGVKPVKNLSVQIQEMLNKNTYPLEEGEIKADVRFTINKNGEIVILSVDTEDVSLEGFVKGRLNYQKVELTTIQEGKIYSVPVRVMA